MSSERKAHRVVAAIGIFQLSKALLLFLLALAVFRLVEPEHMRRLIEWLNDLPLAEGSATIARTADWLLSLTPRHIQIAGWVACAYSTVFAVEGVGLWLQQRWAEYLTAIVTASLIPFELWELARQVTLLKLVALALNVAIVWYLVYLLRHERRTHVQARRVPATSL
jgi:uncharacterized membrane protein (DUF2068 family)